MGSLTYFGFLRGALSRIFSISLSSQNIYLFIPFFLSFLLLWFFFVVVIAVVSLPSFLSYSM